MCELMQSRSNALCPTLGFIQYLEHLKLPEYLLGLHMKLKKKKKKKKKKMCELMKSMFKTLSRGHDIICNRS